MEGEAFNGIDYTADGLSDRAYEDCTFINCNFGNADLSGINFVECEFRSCSLSMAGLAGTTFRDVKFRECKMLGLHFEDCNELLFSVSFDGCQLDLSSFYQRPMKGTPFRNCSLREVDFTETGLAGAVFEGCDLSGAVFEKANLEGADLRTAYNYSIDPELNRMRKAKFSAAGLAGLLKKYGLEISD